MALLPGEVPADLLARVAIKTPSTAIRAEKSPGASDET
jgi:hypothetical protein